jgi:hypothetical protein
MRVLWVLCCLLATTTAHADPAPVPAGEQAQPAPSVTPAPSAPAPVAPAPLPIIPAAAVAPAPGLAPPGSMPVVCPEVDAPEIETTPGYRWQIAAADIAGVTLALSGNGSRAGVAIYLLDGLVIHSAHGRYGSAAASVLLRASLPIAGGYLLGSLSAGGGDDDELPVGIILGFGIGVATAAVIDAAFLAAPVTVRKQAKTWTPRVSATQDRVTFGVTGAF